MQFLDKFSDELLDVNDGSCPFLSGEASILCNVFSDIFGVWAGSTQSKNCVSFLCDGKGPSRWLVQNPERSSSSVVESPPREKKAHLMFVVPLTENTEAEICNLAKNAKFVMNNKKTSFLRVFGRGFVRYAKGHVYCVFAECPRSHSLRWYDSPPTMGVWMEKFYQDCKNCGMGFDRELTTEDFVFTDSGVMMANFDKFEPGEFDAGDKMKFLCVLMELVIGRNFLLYSNTTRENFARRVRKTLEREKTNDKGNVLPLIWKVLEEL
ncbi:hypothetical protein ISTM_313 [Insectomime virus]|uniref:Uncharacterized protein n=1 Tax=Tunisvirus fontaine2 TaxID=1421067 RepID=V9SDD8_9VIRU|nr:hypothetical protein D1R32_gp003 [Tunisvirus fontaine2]AHA46211.1 hypothetical protein ISTM_313 [Insectomime virus]AHC54720.1 hypothetical protein TNS_ORF2 [Tunisvirus fontaine2]